MRGTERPTSAPGDDGHARDRGVQLPTEPVDHGHGDHGHGDHGHVGHGHGEVDWSAMAAAIELQGDVLAAILDQAVAIVAAQCRGQGLQVDHIIDIGSGPGVGSTVLARAFDRARVTAVDGSEAMTARARDRFERLGLSGRVEAVTAELPGGLAGRAPAQVVWAAMVMHHLGDEAAVLRAIGAALEPGGLIVLLEFGDELRFLPDGAEVEPPGLLERMADAGEHWVAGMRAELPDAVASDGYPTMLVAAGFELVADRLIGTRLEAPLGPEARSVVIHQLERLRTLAASRLDEADLAALDRLLDPDASDGVARRPDVVLEWSRHLYVARALPDAAGTR